MVLSPIEPVAPSTDTVRTAEAVALLLRNGTALIFSPNHKTAADAIHARPQNSENRRQNHPGDESIKPIEKPPLARKPRGLILDAKAPVCRGLKEIAELRDDRQHGSDHEQRRDLAEA